MFSAFWYWGEIWSTHTVRITQKLLSAVDFQTYKRSTDFQTLQKKYQFLLQGIKWSRSTDKTDIRHAITNLEPD